MIADNLKLFFLLYVRPRAALSGIIDEGSFFFGLAAVTVLSVVSTIPSLTTLPSVLRERAPAAHHTSSAKGQETDGEDEPKMGLPVVATAAAAGFGVSTFMPVAGLVLLYVPAVVFVMTLLDRRAGSFGVALPRDYGQLAPCALMSWAAAQLPFVLVGLLAGPAVSGFAFWAASTLVPILYFLILMTLAVRLVYGVGPTPAFAASIIGAAALPFAPCLTVLASPFALYWAFVYLRGDIGDIQRLFGSRRSFRRHLEAATINPRDAEAHYQLGLIHQHRRQYTEAIARFEKAIEIDRSEIDAHYQLGRIAREQGRQADAIRHFEPVVAKDPKHSRHEVWREIGATYIEAGDFAHARPMLERYVENRPYDPEGLFWLGFALKKLGETEHAREMQARCIEASKTAPDYRKGELRHWRKRAQQEL
jgi:Tfp pilus assembly protein PilF